VIVSLLTPFLLSWFLFFVTTSNVFVCSSCTQCFLLYTGFDWSFLLKCYKQNLINEYENDYLRFSRSLVLMMGKLSHKPCRAGQNFFKSCLQGRAKKVPYGQCCHFVRSEKQKMTYTKQKITEILLWKSRKKSRMYLFFGTGLLFKPFL
jgi:hypothetical protein